MREAPSLLLDEEVAYLGPSLEEAGALPAVFYFALSAEESLALDPFDQPAHFLREAPLRVFSLTLPGHEPGREKTEAIAYWAKQFTEGSDPITACVKRAESAITKLIDEGWIDKRAIGAAGLSRGAFVATHLAASDERISHVCGYSPLTSLLYQQDFKGVEPTPLISDLALTNVIPHLLQKEIRFYIGNRDTRVGSDLCLTFIRQLAEAQFANKQRSPAAELTLFRSIGHRGHGTPPDIFRDGANWLATQLTEKLA